MNLEEPPPPLALAEVASWLELLGDLTGSIVLIGGQALAFWASQYAARFPLLQPVNSRDIDFCGEREMAAAAAQRLGGRLWIPDADDQTPSTGLVRLTGQGGYLRQIDFLRYPFGLNFRDVLAEAVDITVPFDTRQVHFKVMNPIHCLVSRISNVGGLPGYQTEHALNQARTAVLCAREYVRERLGAPDDRAKRAALRLNERIYRFAWVNRHALAVFRAHNIDAFEAVLVDDRLGEQFRSLRYPQMVEGLTRKRRIVPTAPQ